MALAAEKITELTNYKLTPNVIKKLTELAEKFPEKNSAVIPGLHVIQDEFGWLPDQAIREFANLIDSTPNKIYSVASFYTMFNLKPVGKYHIQICRNVSCQLMGAKNMVKSLTDKLNINPGETTKDQKYTISLVECLGSCGTAPVMMINDKYYENLTEQKVDEILKTLQ